MLASTAGTLRVVSSKPFGQGRFIVQFEGVAGREAAERLHGVELEAEPLEVPGAPRVHELAGAVVRDGDGTELGRVAAVEANPASDLLVLDVGGTDPAPLRRATRGGRGGQGRHPRRPPRPVRHRS